MTTLIPLANLKGQKGDTGGKGDPGIPGTNAVPADNAVAGYVAGASSTRDAITADVKRRQGVVSVADYGAVADWNGTSGTDNLAAFNAALAATPEGGTLVVPAGAYYLSGTFAIDRSIDFTCGAGGFTGGPTGTELVFAAATGGIKFVNLGVAPSKWRIGPFHITSLSTVAGTDVGIFVPYGRGVIDGVTVEKFGSHGIHVKAGTAFGGGNANNTDIRNARSYGNRGDGIRVEGSDANACILYKPDVVANYGWGVNIVSASVTKIIAPHADQQYNGSPGAYRDAGNSNSWDWPYAEVAGNFLIDTGSSNGELSCSQYGAPTIQTTGSLWSTWRISAEKGTYWQQYTKADGTQQYKVAVGGVNIDSFDITNATSATRILSVDAGNLRAQWFQSQWPNATNTLDLGASSVRWRNLFVAGFVSLGTFATASRPTAASAGAGAMIYDSTLGIPLWSNGTNWRDATGTNK